jgi:hypothetical protein
VLRGNVLVAGAERQGGEAPGGAKLQGAKRHGTMESTRGHRASRSDAGDGWSGQTRGGWTMVPAQGPLVDGGWCEGWLVDYASTGTPRFVEEDDVRFFYAKREVVGR